MKIENIDLRWLGHSGFLIENSKTIYIDPFQISEGLPKADLILITHSHYDHCSIEDLRKIVTENTKIVLTADCQSKITKFEEPIKMIIAEPGQEFDFSGIKIIAVPSYNINKEFHPKDEGWLGYLIKMEDIIIYHAGDSDIIPEMQKLTGHNQKEKTFVALLPVGGRFTMNPEEAFEVANLLKPSLAIPMHWGSIVGTKEDAEEFCELCTEKNIKAKILDKI